jgi:hypothetical protein
LEGLCPLEVVVKKQQARSIASVRRPRPKLAVVPPRSPVAKIEPRIVGLPLGTVRSLVGPQVSQGIVALFCGRYLNFPTAVNVSEDRGLLIVVDSNGDQHFLPRFSTVIVIEP